VILRSQLQLAQLQPALLLGDSDMQMFRPLLVELTPRLKDAWEIMGEETIREEMREVVVEEEKIRQQVLAQKDKMC
jgi:hypothetical protein